MKKYIFAAVIIALVLSGTILRLLQPSLEKKTYIIFCNVGQGDAVLLIQDHYEVLVDGGPANKGVLRCLNEYLPMFDQTIELVISTHPDADHLAGLVDVLDNFRVEELWAEGRVTNTQLFQTFTDHIRHLPSLKVISPASGLIKSFPRIGQLEVIYPFLSINSPAIFLQALSEKELLDLSNAQEKQIGSTNNGSISTFLSLRAFTLLMTGDADSSVELALLQHYLIPQVSAIKVGHHGSKSSSDRSFLGHLQPEVAIVSVGKQNRYGHPAPELMERLKSLNIQIYRTDVNGDVIFTIDESAGNYVVTSRE